MPDNHDDPSLDDDLLKNTQDNPGDTASDDHTDELHDDELDSDELDDDELDDELPFLKTLDALGVPFKWQCPITPESIAYLAEHRPFIQLTTADGVTAYDKPKIMHSKAGWVIVNYGDAICCSLGDRLFNYAGLKHKDDDDSGDGKPVGTIKGQTFLTAGELVALAKQQGWQNIHIVDGLPAMIWAIWVHGQRQGVNLSNYNPTQTDQDMRERLERDSQKDMIRRGIRQQG